MTKRMLEVRDLQGWYGESHVLHGVNFHVDEGEVVTLLGRNGAGRTSTLRAIMGLTGLRKGSIKINGVESIGMPTYRIAHLGVGYCPEERGIFSSLSAEENLLLPPVVRPGRTGLWTVPYHSFCPSTPHANSTRFAFPTTTAPAASARWTTVACRVGTWSA